LKKQQNSRKIIPLPVGIKKRQIEPSNTNQGTVSPLKSITAGRCTPTELLTRSRYPQEAMGVSRKTRGVHGDKIQALRERIEAGEYRVEPEGVAEKLLEQAICELLRAIFPSYTNRSHHSHDQCRKPASL
jgi:anti-sigma28 factor (negative regulator of flagellin synthesis)